MSLSKKMSRIDSSPIRRAFELASKIENPINFSIGQPHFPCPQNIVEAMKKALDNGKTSYTLTAGIPELREAMANKYRTENSISYATAERVLVTSGISSSLFLLFNALVDPDDECLVISPYFLMYPSMLGFYGAKVTTLDQNFTPEMVSKLKDRKFKLIIFSSPSNPTGKILSKTQLTALAELAESTGAHLISDEIYELFDYDNKFISVGSFYEKTITLSGFSKTYNMTGLRLSTILAPQEIITALTTLQQYTVVCAPAPVQWAGLEALKTDMSSYIQDYREKRDYVYDNLKDHYEVEKSDGAFYFFLKVPIRDEDFVNKAVEKEKLILVPGYIFCEDHNHVRLSFASEWDSLKKGIAALQRLA
ncbi:pyridoxal phosphate-dependent aminotransferase [Leptospira sp. GIMC2001]|uniref:pyridoxal phosphate-dependent aminotransferase n=1 Tax=Leptospira sp. GIMC2001 TaxID=1513297 RepID=UPI00234B64BA|nr:aminotransferase class I/II-fold pyridoxal phosphate-dependent enzyme [Leptospira sp. GIMC2001]WCL48382.1 aminotransferase class I/II-fold pyridoxal phosphate-dependent enzyme [Leptospira sp. GIMC2001]